MPKNSMLIEYIPDEHQLYRRIHPQHLKKTGEISSATFIGEKVSVDWEKYTTLNETLRGWPDNQLASILAGIPRQKDQEVKHDPVKGNQAHSLIIGHKTKSIRRFLARNSKLIS